MRQPNTPSVCLTVCPFDCHLFNRNGHKNPTFFIFLHCYLCFYFYILFFFFVFNLSPCYFLGANILGESVDVPRTKVTGICSAYLSQYTESVSNSLFCCSERTSLCDTNVTSESVFSFHYQSNCWNISLLLRLVYGHFPSQFTINAVSFVATRCCCRGAVAGICKRCQHF